VICLGFRSREIQTSQFEIQSSYPEILNEKKHTLADFEMTLFSSVVF